MSVPDPESAANDVAQILNEDVNPFTGDKQNIGKFNSGKTWNIAVGQEPNKPPDCITIYDSLGSTMPVPCINLPGTQGEATTALIQIRIRSTDYLTGMSKINECYKAIQNLGPYVTPSFRYSGFLAQSTPYHIGEDDSTRQLFIVNFSCFRARPILDAEASASPSAS